MKSIKNVTLKTLAVLAGVIVFYACGSSEQKKEETTDSKTLVKEAEEVKAEDNSKGVGKFTHVDVSPTLDKQMADAGKKIYDVKCSACHRLTDEKLVGPGWKNVTKTRTAEWIMNFATNPDEMLDTDAIAQGLLEECLVRMPNQGLSDDDARHVYEFMRENDGVK
ncbi:MAG: cytochrome c [Bacteroidetes bacterium]|jgi:cytochrome c5|nr:cytochrome c [Bacteroidota bacterium]